MENEMKAKSFEITADTLTVEVKDKTTGETYRRELPIDYFENAYAIRLRAESMDGKPVEMAFFSNIGLGRLKDLTGGGADADPCGGHGKSAK